MSDSADKSVKIQIDVDNANASAGLAQTKTELEGLTNSGKGLASELPDMTGKTDQFRVANESEYKILIKAHEALGEKIRLTQAAGGEISGLVAKQAALSEALSTERALQIATALETRAANNAKLQSAIADNAAAAAALENAAAHKVLESSMHGNAGAMREAFVIGRELERGNYSRMAGSVSILAGRLGLLELAFTPVGAAAAVAVAGIAALSLPLVEAERHCRMLEDSTKDLTAILSGMDELESTNKLMDEFATKTDDATDSTKELESATESLEDTTRDALEAQKQSADYAKTEAEAREKLAEAIIKQKVAAGEMTPAQGKAALSGLKEKAGDDEAKAQSKGEQDEINTLKGQLKSEQGIQAGLDKKKFPAEGKKQQADYAAAGAEAELRDRTGEVDAANKNFAANHKKMTKDESDAAYAHIVQINLLKQQAEDNVAKTKAAAKAQDDAYAKIISGLAEAAKKITDLNREIAAKTTAHTAADAHRATMGDLAHQTAAAEQSGGIATAVAAIDKAKTSDAAAKALQAAATLLGANEATMQNFLAIVQYHQQMHSSTAQEVAALKNAVATQAAQMSNVQSNGQ